MSAATMDRDFAEHLKALGPRPAPTLFTSVFEYREAANNAISNLLNFPVPDNIVETKHLIKSFDGAEIAVHRFVKSATLQARGSQPALLYFHGGGTVACPIDDVCRPGVAKQVHETGVQMFAVEYRMAPENPFPVPVEDCYAAVQWVQANAAHLNVDPARVGIYGESGGGCLAAGVALMARDRGLTPKLAKQLLIYPMLDHRCKQTSDSAWEENAADMRNSVKMCWSAYIGSELAENPEAAVSPYASASRADTLAGLPPTYIDCGGLDALRNESVEYAARLVDANVDVEMHLYPGVPHVFEMLAPNSRVALNALENRKRAIQYI